ncbi:8-amino-7-oxononanoate synthase [Thalassotalea psychrophila]|uniref:8-amino-7-oxononanoate synthase n=1 Tax=Thalassotalea psychrophila TaxID=3065647 RepID=A0ABY9TRX1_9GAMM|nr:8-amino-7-oxononanoate synthase [Colwelliaceae bacterium SQ149]
MSFSFIQAQLAKQQALNLYRTRKVLDKGTGRLLIHQGVKYINFSSNDYLGLSQHPDIKSAYIKGIEQYGCGSGSSSLVTGYSKAHQELEELIADWQQAPKCLLFSTGFSANSGVLSTLGQNTNTGFYLDKLSHASLIDGAFNSRAKSKRFKHNDINQLNEMLSNSNSIDKLIIAEGVYSMDGDTGNLSGLNDAALKHQANLYIDDAHGVGVLGNNGQGTFSQQGIEKGSHLIQMITFGKALATQGAAVTGSEEFIDYLVNRCRDYIYSTAMPAANALATIASIKLCHSERWRREKISKLTNLFKSKLDECIEITDSESSIIGILTGSEESALFCQQQLKNNGFWLTAIRPPTVENGKSRLRVTITSNHNDNDISELANRINEVIGKCLQNK